MNRDIEYLRGGPENENRLNKAVSLYPTYPVVNQADKTPTETASSDKPVTLARGGVNKMR